MVRIISLIASATEIVCALGYQDELVGRSHECDFPASILDLPVATKPRFETGGSSKEIDDRVKAQVAERGAEDALGVYEVFADKLRELKPTHIITQTQCEVCAVSLKDLEVAVRELTGFDAQIVSLQPNSLGDVYEDFMRVAEAIDDPASGRRLVSDCRNRLQRIAQESYQLEPRPRVAGIEWADPLMAFGNWTPSLIGIAGGDEVLGKADRHSPQIDFAKLVAADPDVIVFSPCGFDLKRALEDLEILEANTGWGDLRAVKTNRVYVSDGNQYFNRAGPRLVETAEILAEILHPECFSLGHANAWRQVTSHKLSGKPEHQDPRGTLLAD